jgi:hypothetical protein
MKIVTDISDTCLRVLTKDDNTKYNISDGEIIKYTGIYYMPDPNNSIPLEIEATFIGKIECERYHHTTGISGIYINPLYIFYDASENRSSQNVGSPHIFSSNANENEGRVGGAVDSDPFSGLRSKKENDESSPGHKWHKIINYKLPDRKYFYYPHLLMLPETYYHFQPLYFFHTVEQVSLAEFEKNTPNMGEIELHYIYY